ncbi:MAG TPA: hypothetical protein VN740_04380 [Solirubrobacteraceae bacterium]|nr:hypothetical protein [Solirubrobacteraceae bacterium]
MQFDPRRMRPAECSALVAAALLAVALFEPWFELSGVRHDAWSAVTATAVLGALSAAGGLILVAVTATRRSPSLPLAAAVFTVVLALASTVLIAVGAASPPALASARCFGLWLGLAGSLGVLLSAWFSLRDERPFWGVPVSR